MILGQLIQTGRHFCECRSHDFIPKSEETVVVISYTIHDQFKAHSFDTDLLDIKRAIKSWLFQVEAVGYLLIRRKLHGAQREFPSPIGRLPMDRVTLTAATQHDFKVVSFYLEKVTELDSFRLVPTKSPEAISEETRYNLFRFREFQRVEDPRALSFEFEEFAK
ncbi:hypothetical protein [Pelagicoccus sp. SDUM812002]|uniref:hypothetical protein n=1 Tax=Pelagicoccus sp. SDUM812002 TaxID=3041266 RepID=UPI00280D624B|nr:hypothetical protein [Pelagicoccus sp. SDUM812002]MDQ8186878.1 hypothetical protein [Pelagicoccus sp. SDUM812002]